MTQDPNVLKTIGGKFLLFNLRHIVDAPDLVEVREVIGTQATVLEVSVEPGDIRRIIGRQGRTAEALRELLIAIGGKEGRRYMLEILEPENISRGRRVEYQTRRR